MFELGAMVGQKDTNLEAFKVKVRKYCRLAEKTQQALANELNYPYSSLSSKLNGSGNSVLTINDVRGIIRVLATWQAINLKTEALELLQLRNLSCNTFSKEDWIRPPLNRLEAGEIYNRLLSVDLHDIPEVAVLINNIINVSSHKFGVGLQSGPTRT